mgnify:CR=1 FL=1
MDTTHTTNTVEFVDWRAKAKAKLEDENKAFKGGREAQAVRDYILKTLIYFADQEPRFAEVICNTKRTFSDLDAYRRAVQFYFPNAEVEFIMNVKLTGAAPTADEMQKPASIKPQEPAAPRPAAPAKPKKEPAAKPVSKPKKAKEDKTKQDDGIMQLSLWG